MSASPASEIRHNHQLTAYRIALFQAHAAIVLEQHLQGWARALGTRPDLRSRVNPEQLAVIVDDRPTPLLRMTVLNTLLMGKLRWRVKLFSSPAAFDASCALFADLRDWVTVQGVQIGEARQFSWMAYNLLFKNPEFWASLEARRLLIVQTDTLLIEPPDPEVFRYGYVGSPWAKGRFLSRCFPRYSAELELQAPVWETQSLCGSVPAGLSNGNGGLSVRNRDLMVRISRSESSAPEEAEDIFFCRHLAAYDPDPAPAAVVERFSCETAYAPSCGSHAGWRYIDASEMAQMFERHFKHVVALTRQLPPPAAAEPTAAQPAT